MRGTIGGIGYPSCRHLHVMARAGLGRVLNNILSARDFEVGEAGKQRHIEQRLKPFGGFAR
ncbi:MAG: hypothetical protein NPIRA02_35840 [Nitrospirales bacterium]|nr:MAG: hypothetical protein NPIRA02_35840 [Nitrospirales bacterium]